MIGYKQVIKGLQTGVVKDVLVASNGKSFLESIKLVAGGVPVKLITESSKELGIMCRKPFNITVLGLREGRAGAEQGSKTKKEAPKEENKPKEEKSKKEKTAKKTTKKSKK